MGGKGGKGSHRTCVICGITERKKKGSLLFSQFPLNEYRCKAWLRAVGNEELVHLPIEKLHQLRYVCGNHFQKKDFNKKGNRLKKCAIPMLNLTAKPLTDAQLIDFPQRMWKTMNVSTQDQPETRDLTRKQREPSGTVSTQDQPSPGPSTSKQKEPSNTSLDPTPSTSKPTDPFSTVLIPKSAKRPRDSDDDDDDEGKPVKQIKSQSSAPTEYETRTEASTSKQRKLSSTEVIPKPTKRPRNSDDNDDEEIPVKHIKTPKSSVPTEYDLRAEASTSKQREPSSFELTPKSPNRPRDVNDDDDSGKSAKQIKFQKSSDLTPRKKKLLRQLNKTKCTLRSLKKSAKLIEKIESPVLKEIVLNASKNQHRNPKGRRWTTQNKISALAIFKRSPKTYRYLNKIMPLPSEKTLQNILKKIPMTPGINKAVLNHLKNISKNRDSKDNLCCLLFDEMAIKPRLMYNIASDIVEGYEDCGDEFGRTNELADHALVFMIQGLRQKFKQPIAFYLVKGTICSQKLSRIIKVIINEISATGFKVLNTVCDQGPTNLGALKLLVESSGPTADASKHYFVINNQPVYIVYDVPHLFKSIRNNFQKNGAMEYRGKKAYWCHLKELEEKNRNFLYLSKITQNHVDPKYRAKMKVKYAAQILSNTVAAVLKLMSAAERNPIKCNALMESALVIQELDFLFDYTNGPSGPDDLKKGRRENVSLRTDHMNKWGEIIKSLSTMKFFNKHGVESKNVTCIEGYITSLKSLRDIWQTVNKLGFKYFNLRQVNQDSLENLFGIIRQSSPTNRNPTCAHFVAALKTAVITKLSAPHSRGSNCEADHKTLLTDFHNIIFESGVEGAHLEESVGKVEQRDEIEYPTISIPEEDLVLDNLSDMASQPVVYVSGYIASKIVEKTTCEKCLQNIRNDNPLDSDIYNYIQLREWWEDKRSLTYPSVALCQLVQMAIIIMENDVCPRLHEPHICQLAITLFSTDCDVKWFTCDTHSKSIFDIIFNRLGLLFIRRQCQIINRTLAVHEENLSDANKLAQQLGKAK